MRVVIGFAERIMQIRALLGSFTGKSLHALKQIPGLPPKRADLIIPGTAVVLATMEFLGAKRLYVSTRGLRYGVLTALMRETESNRMLPGRANLL